MPLQYTGNYVKHVIFNGHVLGAPSLNNICKVKCRSLRAKITIPSKNRGFKNNDIK